VAVGTTRKRAALGLGLALLAAAAAGGAAPAARAETAPAPPAPTKVFLLPIAGAGGAARARDERRLLEARLHVTLGRARQVAPVIGRDLPAAARRALPPGLEGCASPECLRSLWEASGAERALALELLDEGPEAVVFATLFDTRTGRIVERREFPQPAAAPATRVWADDVARWVARAAPPRQTAPPLDEDRRPPSAASDGPLLAVSASPAQGARSEAQALAAELAARLAARGRPRLLQPAPALPAGTPPAPGPARAAAAPPPVSHHAVVTVDSVAVSQRTRHVHHHRTGRLIATLTISDVGSGTVVFSHRAFAEASGRARHNTESQIAGELVARVVAGFMDALERQDIDHLLRLPQPNEKRGQP
jgi:hypothetical protein